MSVHRTTLVFAIAIYDGHEPLEGREPASFCTWARFVQDNAEAEFAADLGAIALKLIAGEAYRIGGGAAGAYTLCRFTKDSPAARLVAQRLNASRGAA